MYISIFIICIFFIIVFKRRKTTTRKCPKCNGKLIKKKGKFGDFFGCDRYPACSYTKPVTKLEDKKAEEFIIPTERIVRLKNNEVSIISGQQECYNCKKRVTVSGLGLVSRNTLFLDYPNMSILGFYGFDIYTIPWNRVFHQLPMEIQEYIKLKYSIIVAHNNHVISNRCPFCKKTQSNYYVFFDTGQGSPFDCYSEEQLYLENIIGFDKEIKLEVELLGSVSPNIYYMKRTTIKNTNL